MEELNFLPLTEVAFCFFGWLRCEKKVFVLRLVVWVVLPSFLTVTTIMFHHHFTEACDEEITTVM
jgi:hypothetical protein